MSYNLVGVKGGHKPFLFIYSVTFLGSRQLTGQMNQGTGMPLESQIMDEGEAARQPEQCTVLLKWLRLLLGHCWWVLWEALARKARFGNQQNPTQQA